MKYTKMIFNYFILILILNYRSKIVNIYRVIYIGILILSNICKKNKKKTGGRTVIKKHFVC